MGLDCSHDAFHGAYGAFNRLRQLVCFVTGGSFPPHYKRNADGSLIYSKGSQIAILDDSLDPNLIYFGKDLPADSGLSIFLSHSDCDGDISPTMCSRVADELEALLPKISSIDSGGSGHILSQGGYTAVLTKFIAGCREAASKNESLLFL